MKKSYLLYKILLASTLIGSMHAAEKEDSLSPHKAYEISLKIRISACLSAGAIGDARGNPVEFDTYTKNGFANLGNKPVTSLDQLPTTLPSFREGAHIVTDDTIMTELTLQACLEWRDQDEPGGVQGLMKRIAQATLDNHDLDADDYRWSGNGRAPGPTCINGIESFRKTGKWDLKAANKHTPGTGGGCGKVMDSAAFGIAFYDQPTRAASLAALHSRISHADVVSQSACAAMAVGIALAISGKRNLSFMVTMMQRVAEAVSILHYAEEEKEWNATPVQYKPTSKQVPGAPPYTVAQRIADARTDEANGVSPDEFYEENKGWGAPDFISSVVFTALRAQRKQWSVSTAINRVINTTAGTDRDSLASGVGQFLGALDGPPSGIDTKEFEVLERSAERYVLAKEATEALLSLQ